MDAKRQLIDGGALRFSVARRCDLLGLPRSSYYYEPMGVPPYDLVLMRLLDEQYTKTPFYGVPRMTAWLQRQSHPVGPKRVRRLLRQMGLVAVYPKPRLSLPAPGHRLNNERLHSGIGYIAPRDKLEGRAPAIVKHRFRMRLVPFPTIPSLFADVQLLSNHGSAMPYK